MKKGHSQRDQSISSSQQLDEDKEMVDNISYHPHSLPFKLPPVPPPRQRRPICRAHSTQHEATAETTQSQPKRPLSRAQSTQCVPVQVTAETSQSRPLPPLPHTPSFSRHRPMPLPRQPQPPTAAAPSSASASTVTVRPSRGRSRYYSSLLTLGELAQKPLYLPATVETIDGFYDFGQQYTVSTGERLSVHFVKRVQMIVLSDCMGFQYHVPLGSAMQFALCGEKDEEFQSVSDILKRRESLPRVICSKQYIPRKGKQEAIEKGEILILRQKQSQKLNPRLGISSYSLRTNRKFELLKDCKGAFTTAAEQTKMYLLDMVTHFSHLFPCKVRLYPPASSTRYCQFNCGRTFTLKDYTTVTSLVVSCATSPDPEFFDIALEENLSKLRVSVLEMQCTTSSTYSAPRHQLYARLLGSDFESGFQSILYTTLRPELATEGTELVNSTTTVPDNDRAYDEMQDEDDYDYVEFGHSSLTAKNNREYLKSLSIKEVVWLLDVMGLGMYKAKFLKEKVRGSFLAECSQHQLQSYLGISNHTHCEQLLEIISGQKSARKLLSEHHS